MTRTDRPLPRLAVVAGVIAVTAALAPPASGQPGDQERDLVAGEVVLVAGSGDGGYSGDGLDARDARLGSDLRVHVAPDGIRYIADKSTGRLRAVATDGVIDTVAGTTAPRSASSDSPGPDGRYLGQDNAPSAAAVAADGSLYVAAEQGILRRGPDGTFTVFAGAGELGFNSGDGGGDGRPATEAWIPKPSDIAVDTAGNVYVADSYHHRIRKIDPSGTISTIAGGGELDPQDPNGQPATAVDIPIPASLAVDSRGAVYFATERDETVHKVEPDGTLTTVVEFDGDILSGDGGPATSAGGGEISSIAMDAEDNLYLTDTTNRQVRMVDPDGTISTITPVIGGEDLAVGPDGDLYVTNGAQVHRLVRHGSAGPAPVRPAGGSSRWAGEDPGTVITVAGTDRELSSKERGARLRQNSQPLPTPSDIAAGPDGTVYYADAGRNEVGSVAPDGTVTVLVAAAEDGLLDEPGGVAAGPDGGVYVTDTEHNRIHLVKADGTSTIVAGTAVGRSGYSGDGGPATKATLGDPQDITVDTVGNLYVTSRHGGRLRKIDAAGIITTLAGGGERWRGEGDNHPGTEADLQPVGPVAVGADGTVYFAEPSNPAVRRVGRDGILTTIVGDSDRSWEEAGFAGDGGPAATAEVNNPAGLATGPDGALYIADTYNNRVRKIDGNGVITTIAGTGERADLGDRGPATEAALTEPGSVTVDPDGNVYVATASGRLRKIDTSGTITMVTNFRAGQEHSDRTGDGGPATDAILGSPNDLALDPAGTLYVAGDIGQVRAVGTDGQIASLGWSASMLAAAPDGSLYLETFDTSVVRPYPGSILRRYPGGAEVTVAAGGGGPVEEPKADGELATTTRFVLRAIATGPDGELYLMAPSRVYRLGEDGRFTSVVEGGFFGMNIGQDGTLYVADREDNRVLRIEGNTAKPFAGNGEAYGEDSGDGGPATEAVLNSPTDVAVADDGTVYISTLGSVRRVDPDGDIVTVFTPAGESDDGTPTTPYLGAIALDTHGDLYVAVPDAHRVLVVVRVGEIPGPFPWFVVWLGAGVVVAVGALAFLAYRRTLPGFLSVRRQPRKPQ